MVHARTAVLAGGWKKLLPEDVRVEAAVALRLRVAESVLLGATTEGHDDRAGELLRGAHAYVVDASTRVRGLGTAAAVPDDDVAPGAPANVRGLSRLEDPERDALVRAVTDQDHELVPRVRLDLQPAGLDLRGRVGLRIRDDRDRQSRRFPPDVRPVHGARGGGAAEGDDADEGRNDDAHGATPRVRNAAVG